MKGPRCVQFVSIKRHYFCNLDKNFPKYRALFFLPRQKFAGKIGGVPPKFVRGGGCRLAPNKNTTEERAFGRLTPNKNTKVGRALFQGILDNLVFRYGDKIRWWAEVCDLIIQGILLLQI